jgi:glutamine amidotransferase
VRIVVLDYGSGNVRSAVRAVEKAATELFPDEPPSVELTSDRAAAVAADGLVVPGVGAFAACMSGLHDVGAAAVLRERLDAGRPVLGICVGMQVLFEAGIEHGVETPGLGLLPGRVEPLRAPVVPHMGWNTVTAPPGSVLFAELPEDVRFYFVHSYAVRAADDDRRIDAFRPTFAEHGERFVAAVESPALSATQFHPEKSGAAGRALLRNWIAGSIVGRPLAAGGPVRTGSIG